MDSAKNVAPLNFVAPILVLGIGSNLVRLHGDAFYVGLAVFTCWLVLFGSPANYFGLAKNNAAWKAIAIDLVLWSVGLVFIAVGSLAL